MSVSVSGLSSGSSRRFCKYFRPCLQSDCTRFNWSSAALAWVTEEEIHCLRTTGAHGEPGAPSEQPGRISRTTYEILAHLALIPELVDPELAGLAEEWLREHGSGQG